MFVTFGEKLFGVVDRVPGHFYVATPFLYFCEIPIFPGRSYLVVDGSQVDPTVFRKGSFSGYSIYWSLKSILMAWFRALLAVLGVAGGVLAPLMYLAYYRDTHDLLYLHIAWAATAMVFFCLFAYWLSLRLTRASPRRLAALARRLEGKYPQAALVVHTYLKENSLDSGTAENGPDDGSVE